MSGNILVERLLLQAGHQFRRQRQVNGIDRDRADRVVGAVVVAGLVDGQHLQQPDLLVRAKGDGLANGLRVADAKIVLMSQGKYRHQRAGQTWISGFGH